MQNKKKDGVGETLKDLMPYNWTIYSSLATLFSI